MRCVVLLTAAALLAPLSLASQEPRNLIIDGFVACIEFDNALAATVAGTVVLVDSSGSIKIDICVFRRLTPVRDEYGPFEGTFTLDLYPLEIDAGTNLPLFSDEEAVSVVVVTDAHGRASVSIPAASLSMADASIAGFLVTLTDCSQAPCRVSAHSVLTNVLVQAGLHAIADISEYTEPNSMTRPTATTLFVVTS